MDTGGGSEVQPREDSSTASAAEQELCAWIGGHGVVLEKLQVAHFPGAGRGIVATNQIEKEEVLLAIPASLMITSRTAAASAIGPLIREVLPAPTSRQRHRGKSAKDGMRARPVAGAGASAGAGAEVLGRMFSMAVLCMLLIYQRALSSPPSPWAPYLRMLPTEFTTPTYMTDADLALLDNRQAIDKLKRHIAKFSDFCNALAPILAAHPELFGTTAPEEVREQIRWAHSVVATRSVYMPVNADVGDIYALVPYGDLFNFAPNHSDGAFSPADNCFRFTARRSYAPGDQIFLSYGAHNNLKLLKHYGFLVEGNENDTIDLTPALLAVSQHLSTACADSEERAGASDSDLEVFKAAVLWDNGLYRNQHLTAAGDPSFNLRAAARVSVLSVAERDTYFVALRDEPISMRNETAALKLLADATAHALDSYSTTLQEDETLLSSPSSLTAVQQMAVRWRVEQKRILHKATDSLQAAQRELASSPTRSISGGPHTHGAPSASKGHASKTKPTKRPPRGRK